MEEHDSFLKYIYHEDLYIIDESAPEVAGKPEPAAEVDTGHPVEERAASAAAVEESRPVSYLGSNEQGILILVEDHSDELLNQTDLDLLMKIVESGLKQSKNDFALVNTAKFPIGQVLDEVSYSYLISFGVDLSDLFSNTSPYNVHKIESGLLLCSEPLSSMHQDDQKKKKLWLALKSMFNIS